METFELAKTVWRNHILAVNPDLPCILVGTGMDHLDPLYL